MMKRFYTMYEYKYISYVFYSYFESIEGYEKIFFIIVYCDILTVQL